MKIFAVILLLYPHLASQSSDSLVARMVEETGKCLGGQCVVVMPNQLSDGDYVQAERFSG